jgi:hypothetical protein
VESRLIINLCIRHFESINKIAKEPELLPSAMILSRSLFESALIIIWLLYPNDIFISESRYLSRLKDYEIWISKQIKFNKLLGWDSEKFHLEKDAINNFRNKIQELLEKKGNKEENSKNVREILKEIGEERKYLYYKMLSNYTHGNYYSTRIYKKNLGVDSVFGEFIENIDWLFIYSITWPIFELASEILVLRASKGKCTQVYSHEFKNKIRKALELKNI